MKAVVVDRLKSARDPNDRLKALEALQVGPTSHRQHLGTIRLRALTPGGVCCSQSLADKVPSLVSQSAMPLIVDLLRARHLGQLDDTTAQSVLELLQSLVSHADEGHKALSAFLNPASNLDALLDLLEGTDTLTTVTTLQVRPRPAWLVIIRCWRGQAA